MAENWKDIKGDDYNGRFSDVPDVVEPTHDVHGNHKGFRVLFPHLHFSGHIEAYLPIAAGAVLAALIFGPNLIP